jgi:hypothetical protein
MKQQFLKLTMGLLLAGALFSSCKKDDPEVNEEEVITTVKLTFTPVGGGATLVYQYDDADGPGGAAATQDEIVLTPSKAYNVAIEVLNKTETPVADITTEISAEAEAHRFYFVPSAGSNITVGNLNNDANGVALGLSSTWTTGAVATGNIRVVLRHYAGNPPGKAAADPVDSPKSATDVDVQFSTKVQ